MHYCVYSDESYITAERYRSIGAFSFPQLYEKEIIDRLKFVLSDSCVEEFKWLKLKNAKYRFCAEKLINLLFEMLFEKSIRIDVIIWDTEDSRHMVQGRDDDANFARMFFHLLNNLMKRRERDSYWHIYPDENMAIDWNKVEECLAAKGKWREYFDSELFGSAVSEQFYNIKTFRQVVSLDEPPCHMADLFAGLSVFSKNRYDQYCKWCSSETDQMSLFGACEAPEMTNREKNRFPILKTFVDTCKSKKLGVSINTRKCLHTPDPKNPINFWTYIPQHPLDIAPTR